MFQNPPEGPYPGFEWHRPNGGHPPAVGALEVLGQIAVQAAVALPVLGRRRRRYRLRIQRQLQICAARVIHT